MNSALGDGFIVSAVRTVSIIIINYNYGRFLEAAIKSALAQTWVAVEVIVVDDGSTDESAEVMMKFGDRIATIRKRNGGQASAFNAGVAASHGELVILLDADDILYPDCARRVAETWRPGMAKLQWRLDTIDASGRDVGMQFPDYPAWLTPDAVRRQALRYGVYPWPVASGNAYARFFLEKIGQVPEQEVKNIADGYFSKMAPLYGDVVTMAEVLSAYRVHGANFWAQSAISGKKYATNVGYEMHMRRMFREKVAELGYPVPSEAALLRNRQHVEARLYSLKLGPAHHPMAADRVWRLVVEGILSSFSGSNLSMTGRMMWALWFIFAATLPSRALTYALGQVRGQSGRARIIQSLIALTRPVRPQVTDAAALRRAAD